MNKVPTDMHCAPDAFSRFERTVDGVTGIAEQTGALMRTLAATKPSGVVLVLGARHPDAVVWLMDGLDITTRLVVLVESADVSKAVAKRLGDDIRIATHVQPVLSFLTDIKSHRMDMIVCDTRITSPQLLQTILSLLAPGGIVMCLHQGGDVDESGVDVASELRANRAFQSVRVDALQGLVIGVSRATVPKAGRRRRGGRFGEGSQ